MALAWISQLSQVAWRQLPEWLLPTAFTSIGADEPRIRVQFNPQDQRVAIEAIGMSRRDLSPASSRSENAQEFQRRFSVRNVTANHKAPLAGNYRIDHGVLRFVPSEKLATGETYRVSLRLEEEGAGLNPVGSLIETEFVVPPESLPAAAAVEQVYPSARTIPANRLRFHIHFATPMDRESAWRHLEVLDENGTRLGHFFRHSNETGWDEAGLRLTIALDAAEIGEASSRIFSAGAHVTLVVRAGWRNVRGNLLPRDYRREFTIGPVVSNTIDPRDWRISQPRAGSFEPLMIQFPQSLDRPFIEQGLTVLDAEDSPVPGRVEVTDSESRWRFIPDAAWDSWTYSLEIRPHASRGAQPLTVAEPVRTGEPALRQRESSGAGVVSRNPLSLPIRLRGLQPS